MLGSSDRAAYLDSLELIRELDFDVLVPWAATAGQPDHALTDRADTRRRIDAIIERVAARREPLTASAECVPAPGGMAHG